MTRISLSAGRECLNFTFDRPAGCPIYIYKHAHISAAQPSKDARLPGKDARLPASVSDHLPRCPITCLGVRSPDTVPRVSDCPPRVSDCPPRVSDCPPRVSDHLPKNAQEGPRMRPRSTIAARPIPTHCHLVIIASEARKRRAAIHTQKGFNPRCLAHSLIAQPGYSLPFDDDRLAYPASLIDCDYGDCSVD